MTRLALALAGADSHVFSSLCASCPHAPAGCCSGPPRLDWSDIGRVVTHGGRDWLLAEIAARRVVPTSGGLSIQERRGLARAGGPRVPKCVYHDVQGCTIAAERRPASCNYYVCDAALVGGSPMTEAAVRTVAPRLAARLSAWDATLDAEVRDAWPDGPTYAAEFLDWLAARFTALATRAVGDVVVQP